MSLVRIQYGSPKLLKLRKHIDCWTLHERRQTIDQRSFMGVQLIKTESNTGVFVRKKDSKKDSFSWLFWQAKLSL